MPCKVRHLTPISASFDSLQINLHSIDTTEVLDICIMLELASITLLLGTILGIGFTGEKFNRSRTDSYHLINRRTGSLHANDANQPLLKIHRSPVTRRLSRNRLKISSGLNSPL